jgi:hypothetical protein
MSAEASLHMMSAHCTAQALSRVSLTRFVGDPFLRVLNSCINPPKNTKTASQEVLRVQVGGTWVELTGVGLKYYIVFHARGLVA